MQEFAAYTATMAALLAANKRGDAIALFLADMLPAELIERMRQSPEWPRDPSRAVVGRTIIML